MIFGGLIVCAIVCGAGYIVVTAGYIRFVTCVLLFFNWLQANFEEVTWLQHFSEKYTRCVYARVRMRANRVTM